MHTAKQKTALKALTLAGLSLVTAGPAEAEPKQVSPKLVVVAWDGAADWVIDRLLAAGQLPHLAALQERGAAAEWSLSTYPTKTATAHATLWTGTWPRIHGIADNDLPPDRRDLASVLDSVSGYSSEPLRAEPLFVTAARAGKKVVVLGATQNAPGDPLAERLRRAGVPRHRLISFNGFDDEVADGRLLGPENGHDFDLRVGDTRFRVELFDDPENPLAGFDAVRIRSGRRQAILVPRPATALPSVARADDWSAPFPVRKGRLSGLTFFRLFALSPDGSELALYQHAADDFGGLYSRRQLRAYQEAAPGFHDVPFSAYEDGAFGPPLMAGGDGTAERRALEIATRDAMRQTRAVQFAFERWDPDVVFCYSPMSDSAGHTWIGVLDPGSPVHDPQMAARIWPYYTEVFRHLDGWLGEIVRSAPPETIVALVSDHGMKGARQRVRVNHILESAGLLARHEAGEIDLSRTRIVLEGSDFGLRLNGQEWQGGIVAPEEREATLEAASRALLAARDPATGKALFSAVRRQAELADRGTGGPRAGDLYVEPAPGYYPSSELGEDVVYWDQPWGEGQHGFDPTQPEMHAIFYVAGPGVRARTTVPPVRHIDVAPTLAHLLGIPAPADSEGEVVEAMLEPVER